MNYQSTRQFDVQGVPQKVTLQKLPGRAFARDVTAAMLVFQFKRILIRLFCLEYQHGRHGFC